MIVEVRPATLDDLAAVQRIFRAASLSNADDRPTLLARLEFLVHDGESVRNGATQVAIVAGAVVGFVTTTPLGANDVEIEDLFVEPAWQGRGIGRHLIADVVAAAGRDGRSRMLVTGNPAAERFYRTVGFSPVGTVAVELGTAVRLRRDITASGGDPDQVGEVVLDG